VVIVVVVPPAALLVILNVTRPSGIGAPAGTNNVAVQSFPPTTNTDATHVGVTETPSIEVVILSGVALESSVYVSVIVLPVVAYDVLSPAVSKI
jgi:hypothetical protein